MKFDRSILLTILYCLFTMLYTVYIGTHPRSAGHGKGANFFYFLEFLSIGSYIFFILQGIILRTPNWGVLLLLPLGILIMTICVSVVLLWIIRWGKGDLLERDLADMILMTILSAGLCWYALRWIRPVGKKKTKKAR